MFLNNHYTQCNFLGQEVRENRAFLFRSPRGFPLSVWRVSHNEAGNRFDTEKMLPTPIDPNAIL